MHVVVLYARHCPAPVALILSIALSSKHLHLISEHSPPNKTTPSEGLHWDGNPSNGGSWPPWRNSRLLTKECVFPCHLMDSSKFWRAPWTRADRQPGADLSPTHIKHVLPNIHFETGDFCTSENMFDLIHLRTLIVAYRISSRYTSSATRNFPSLLQFTFRTQSKPRIFQETRLFPAQLCC